MAVEKPEGARVLRVRPQGGPPETGDVALIEKEPHESGRQALRLHLRSHAHPGEVNETRDERSSAVLVTTGRAIAMAATSLVSSRAIATADPDCRAHSRR